MKTIFTRKGQPIYVDDADYDWLVQWCWRIDKEGYAVRSAKSGQKRPVVRMHRMILGVTDPSINVDHCNGIRHDNQRNNLRACTREQNSWNRPAQKNNTSGYKGVSHNASSGKWQASINCNGTYRYLGLYANPEDAHAAYCAAALKYHGEFANTGGDK